MSNPANMSDFVYHGPLSKLTGLNIDVQGSMGRLIPGLQEGLEAIGRHNIEYGALADAATQYFPLFMKTWRQQRLFMEQS